MRQVIQRPQVTDTELVEIVGMPDFLTGCTVTGDFAALTAGRPVELQLQAQVSVADLAAPVAGHPTVLRLREPPGPEVSLGDGLWGVRVGQRCVLVENLPPNASRPDVMKEISEQWIGDGQPGGDELSPVQVKVDISHRGDDRFLCIPTPGTAPERLRNLLLELDGITTTVPVHLPAPLPDLIRQWGHTHQHEDLPASLARLESAIRDQPSWK